LSSSLRWECTLVSMDQEVISIKGSEDSDQQTSDIEVF